MQLCSDSVPTAVGFGLAMAVWAEHSEVREPVIIANAVDMVYLDR